MEHTRVSRKPSAFNADINNQNDYLELDSPLQVGLLIPQPYPPLPGVGAAAVPALKNWQRLWLTPQERDIWRNFVAEFNPLYRKFSDKKEARTTSIREKMFLVMDRFMAFASPIINRIAANPYATVDDLNEFHIHTGLLKDKNPTKASPDVVITEVNLSVQSMKHLVHVLGITFTNHKGKGKPKNVKEVLIYKALSATPQDTPKISAYNYIGDEKNGKFNSVFNPGDEGNFAWYVARVKDKSGKLGPYSVPVNAIIA